MNDIQHAHALWLELSDVPIDEDGYITLPFHQFEPGTHREDIWHWFEDNFDTDVYHLIYPEEP